MSTTDNREPEGLPMTEGTGFQGGSPGEQPERPLPDVMREIDSCNGSSEAHEDLYSRTRLATDQLKQADAEAREADSNWANADLNHKALQAEFPERVAPKPRQWLVAGGFLALDAVACFFAAEALGGSQNETVAWAGLFLALLGAGEFTLDLYRDGHQLLWRWTAFVLGAFVALLGVLRFWFLVTVGTEGLITALAGSILFTLATAGFVAIGYRALRVAETGQAWRARRKVRVRAAEAAAAHRRVVRLKAQRDRLGRAYLSMIRIRLIKCCSASQLPVMEQAIWAHLTGEDQS